MDIWDKMDEHSYIVRYKVILVAQRYSKKEGLDYEDTYAPVTRLEAIRMLLAFACFKNFKLCQMVVNSAFINGFINEEVYVKQPPGFENSHFPIMCLNFQKLYMVQSKLIEFGMKGFQNS